MIFSLPTASLSSGSPEAKLSDSLTAMPGHQLAKLQTFPRFAFRLLIFCWLGAALACPARAQVETVEGGGERVLWVGHGRVEGHLPTRYSPAGAFSPDGKLLAIASENKVVLFDLAAGDVAKILPITLQGISDLEIDSANFVSADQLLILGAGNFRTEGGHSNPTPRLACLWDIQQNAVSGTLKSVGAKGGFQPPRFFPRFHDLVLTHENRFEIWDPLNDRSAAIEIPSLTRTARLFTFSPDGHWLLLAQIEGNSSADPIVVKLADHQFVGLLRGHQGTVLAMAFSPDSRWAATACEDGKVRVYSAEDWKLARTLEGHRGPVRGVEFSPDGRQIVSAGEDHTARVWSAEGGGLISTLTDSQEPLLSVAFSPTGHYIAATSEKVVYVWQRVMTNP